MNSDKCKGTTRKGEPCKNKTMKNSQYCWIHSFGRVKGTPFLKNATLHALLVVISIVLPLVIYIHSCSRTPTRDNQLRMENKIDELLAIRDYNEKNSAELMRRYPLGYVYFAYNQEDRSITTLDRTLPSLDYEVYMNMKVTQLSSERIGVVLPDLIHKQTQNRFISNVINFPRVLGKPQRVPIGTPEVRMWFELLVDDPENLIFLIGFREEKPTDS